VSYCKGEIHLCVQPCACANDRDENWKARKQGGSLSHQHRKLASTESESLGHLRGKECVSIPLLSPGSNTSQSALCRS